MASATTRSSTRIGRASARSDARTGALPYVEGSAPVRASLRAEARPIRVDDRVVALAIPLRDPNFTPYDVTYLDAMQQAMLYGIAAATLLATGLGVFFG